MSSHPYAYRVGRVGFAWKGQRLVLGDVLRGASAVELEAPENAHLLQRCTRMHDAHFAHHDTPDDDEAPAAAAAPETTAPQPAMAAAVASFTRPPDAAPAAEAKE